ncbi:MAG TPA: hypothetical protein PLR07_07400 [Promineifilum sp.]|nr:hypothetical protein [Promineifilum sp.]
MTYSLLIYPIVENGLLSALSPIYQLSIPPLHIYGYSIFWAQCNQSMPLNRVRRCPPQPEATGNGGNEDDSMGQVLFR